MAMLEHRRGLKIEIERGALASGTHVHHRPGFRENGFRTQAETIPAS
jgi:hypothetical protein